MLYNVVLTVRLRVASYFFCDGKHRIASYFKLKYVHLLYKILLFTNRLLAKRLSFAAL